MYLQSALSYLTPPIVAVFLGGLVMPRITRHGAFYTLVGGSALALSLLVAQPSLHFLYVAALLFVASLVLMVVVSVVGPTEEPVGAEFMWQRGDATLSPTTQLVVAGLLVVVALVVGMLW